MNVNMYNGAATWCWFQAAVEKNYKRKHEAYLSLCDNFRPVFRHFFMERFPEPGDWYEKRLAYTRSVATNSIGQSPFLFL